MSHPKQIGSAQNGNALSIHLEPSPETFGRSAEGTALAATPSAEAKRHAAIAAVKEFLTQSAGDEQLRHCKACGATVEHLDAYFWLDGTNDASLVQLPFCPACDPDVLTSLRRKRTAARLDLAS